MFQINDQKDAIHLVLNSSLMMGGVYIYIYTYIHIHTDKEYRCSYFLSLGHRSEKTKTSTAENLHTYTHGITTLNCGVDLRV